jgi:hypothetical protein
VTIKEWGVKAAYTGPMHLQYQISSDNKDLAAFTSQELLSKDAKCTAEYGGWIVRYAPGDLVDGPAASDGPPAAEYFKSQPSSTYSHVSDYYYAFHHTQSACGDNPTATFNLQQLTNTAVAQVASKLQAIN